MKQTDARVALCTVTFPPLVFAGKQTGPTSTGTCCINGVLQGPEVGCKSENERGQTLCSDCCSHTGLIALVIKQGEQQPKLGLKPATF